MFQCRKSVAERNLTGVNECVVCLSNAVYNIEFSQSNFATQVPATGMLTVVVDVYEVERMGFQQVLAFKRAHCFICVSGHPDLPVRPLPPLLTPGAVSLPWVKFLLKIYLAHILLLDSGLLLIHPSLVWLHVLPHLSCHLTDESNLKKLNTNRDLWCIK
jgi:hypothetical protein